MKTNAILTATAVLGLMAYGAEAKTKCPAQVTSAVEKAYPDGEVKSCKQEKENGKLQYMVRVTTSDKKKFEVDASPDGTILQSEEKIKTKEVPQAVEKGFQAKFQNSKITSAEKLIMPDGSVNYEVRYWDNGKKHEATFKEDGAFMEKE